MARSGPLRPRAGRLACGLALALAALPARAEQRLAAPGMPCAAVAEAVAREGAVILDTGPGTYERVVSGQRFCPLPETTAPTWAETADVPQCFVGYRCVDKFNEKKDE
jgi:hypothetical protein